MDKEYSVSGQVLDLFHDDKIKKLNVQLVHVGGNVANGDGYHAIDLEDWTGKDTSKKLVRLHIKDAIALKAAIDTAVYEALTEPPWADDDDN